MIGRITLSQEGVHALICSFPITNSWERLGGINKINYREREEGDHRKEMKEYDPVRARDISRGDRMGKGGIIRYVPGYIVSLC